MEDGAGAGEVGVEGGLLGVHRWLRDVIDDATMNALFDQEAKRYLKKFKDCGLGCRHWRGGHIQGS